MQTSSYDASDPERSAKDRRRLLSKERLEKRFKSTWKRLGRPDAVPLDRCVTTFCGVKNSVRRQALVNHRRFNSDGINLSHKSPCRCQRYAAQNAFVANASHVAMIGADLRRHARQSTATRSLVESELQ